MKNIISIIAFLSVLFWSASVIAHELSPMHYPLASLPVFLVSESWLYLIMFPVIITFEIIVLYGFTRELGIKASLWRVAILYPVGKVTEIGAYFFLAIIGPIFGWVAPGWTSSLVETLGALIFCLVVALIPKIIVALFLYKKSNIGKTQVALAVSLATFWGYFFGVMWCLIVRTMLY